MTKSIKVKPFDADKPFFTLELTFSALDEKYYVMSNNLLDFTTKGFLEEQLIHDFDISKGSYVNISPKALARLDLNDVKECFGDNRGDYLNTFSDYIDNAAGSLSRTATAYIESAPSITHASQIKYVEGLANILLKSCDRERTRLKL